MLLRVITYAIEGWHPGVAAIATFQLPLVTPIEEKLREAATPGRHIDTTICRNVEI